MTILPNSGPLSGKDPNSKHLTSQKIKARIVTETLSNVSVTAQPCAADAEGIDVFGRGAMQLGVLVSARPSVAAAASPGWRQSAESAAFS